MAHQEDLIQKRLHETPELRHEKLTHFKKRIADEGAHMVKLERDDDEFFMRFLRAEHYDIEITFKKLCAYQVFRDEHPELSKNLTALSVLEQLESNAVEILSEYDKRDRPVIWICLRKLDFSDPEKGMGWVRLFYYIAEKAVQDQHCQIDGACILLDTKGAGWNNFSKTHLKLIIDMFQGRCPVRVGQFCVLREPPIAKIAYGMAKPFLSHKFKSRFRFYGTKIHDLEEIVPLHVLPAEIGGGHHSENVDNWIFSLIQTECEKLQITVDGNAALKDLSHHVATRVGKLFVKTGGDIVTKLGLEVNDILLDLHGSHGSHHLVHPSDLKSSESKNTITVLRPVFDSWGRRIRN